MIVGGESGPGARPFDVAWARSTVEQCRAAGVPVFVKQLGAEPYERMETMQQGEPGVIDLSRRAYVPPGWTRVVEAATGEAALYKYHRLKDRKGGDMAEWSPDLRVREFPRGRT